MTRAAHLFKVFEADRTHEAVELWLVQNVSEALEIDPGTLDPRANLEELGLDSLQAICIAGYFEEWIGFKIPASLIEDHPTIQSACKHIMKMIPWFERSRLRSLASQYILEIESGAAESGRNSKGGGHIMTAA